MNKPLKDSLLECCILLGFGSSLAGSRVLASESELIHYQEPSPLQADISPYGFKLEYGQVSASGKSEFISRNSKASIAYNDGIDELRLDADHSYVKSGNTLASDRRRAYAGYDRYIGWRLWFFLLNDYEKNEAIGLNYTQLSGAGFKLDLLRNKTWKSNIGAAYLKRAKQTKLVDEATEIRSNKTQDDRVLSIRFRFSYRLESFRLGTTAFYQPVIDPFDSTTVQSTDREYSWSSESEVSYYLTENVFAKLSYFYRYESLQIKPGQSRREERNMLSFGYEL